MNSQDVCNEGIKLPTRPMILYNTWQFAQLEDNDMYIYSAFYDDRHFLNGKNVLRVFVISTPIASNVYCQIWKGKYSQPILTVAKVFKTESGHNLAGTHYDQFMLTCVLETKTLRPKRLFLVWMNRCDQPQNNIKIQYPKSQDNKPKHEVGVCVPITFGKIDPYRIIEWVEMHRFLGVTEINVFHSNVSDNTMAALKYYEREGIIKLFSIPSVLQENHNRDKIRSSTGLNDCMLRNMYLYKWVLVVDFDEIIFPRNESEIINYNQLMLKVKNTLKPKYIYPISYAFRNSYFWVGCEDKISKQQGTFFFHHFQRENTTIFFYIIPGQLPIQNFVFLYLVVIVKNLILCPTGKRNSFNLQTGHWMYLRIWQSFTIMKKSMTKIDWTSVN